MEQLIMHWYNDGKPCEAMQFPERVTVKTLPQLENGVQVWLDIIRFMFLEPKSNLTEEFFHKTMTDYANFDENHCYILLLEDVPVATITVIFDRQEKQGYIHMVACKPECRGKGFGHLLNKIAVGVLKAEGMRSAYLTTDDWRLAAIKTYLKAGFVPDLKTQPDFMDRWQNIYKQLNV